MNSSGSVLHFAAAGLSLSVSLSLSLIPFATTPPTPPPDGVPTRLPPSVGAATVLFFSVTPFKVWQYNYLRLSLGETSLGGNKYLVYIL